MSGATPSIGGRGASRLARRVIEHHFGSPPSRVARATGGLTNLVFKVRHAEGDFVVRMSPTPEKISTYMKEQWAVAKARKAGVPTPEILEVGNEAIPYPYMISRTVEGREATTHPERIAIVKQMGRYAALVNSIETHDFGGVFDWSHNTLSRKATWADYLRDELELEARLDVLKHNKMLTAARARQLKATLKELGGTVERGSLNHGDVRLKNVLVDEKGNVCAIIDWEHATSNVAPHWELSLALHDLAIDEKQEFLEGYGIADRELLEIAPAVKALNVLNYAPRVEQLAEAGEDAHLERLRIRLSGALDLYAL